MKEPRIAMLVHGRLDSIEMVRARELTHNQPADHVHFLWREQVDNHTGRRWLKEIRQIKPDLLYAINTAWPGAWLAPLLRATRGLPYVLDTGDVVYEMARSASSSWPWQLMSLKFGERMAQKYAHTIVVRGTRHREYLESRGYQNVQVIRDGCAPVDAVDASEVRGLRDALGLRDEFVIGVLGSLVYSPRLEICYGWDLIQALARLRDLPVRGVIIGDGNGRSWLEAQARDRGVADRVLFCGRIPYEKVPVYVRLFDIALSTQTNNLPGQVRTTGKLPEYMNAERFILASRVGEAALLLPEIMLVDYEGTVDGHYPAKLAERIRFLMNNRGVLTARHALKATAERECSYPVLRQTFDRVVAGAGKRATSI